VNAFINVMATIDPNSERCEALAIQMSKAFAGHSTAEVVMGLCFHLNRILEQVPDEETRADVVAGLMRLIDPPKGSG
jgi:hypothetical protein